MERLRTIVIGVEGIALVGVVMFTVAGVTQSRQAVFTILQFACGLVILLGELAMRRMESNRGD